MVFCAGASMLLAVVYGGRTDIMVSPSSLCGHWYSRFRGVALWQRRRITNYRSGGLSVSSYGDLLE